MVNILVTMKMQKIKIHYSLIIFIIISLFSGFFKELLVILSILFIHELGHIITIKLFNGSIKSITITLVGGLMDINFKGEIISRLLVHSSRYHIKHNTSNYI